MSIFSKLFGRSAVKPEIVIEKYAHLVAQGVAEIDDVGRLPFDKGVISACIEECLRTTDDQGLFDAVAVLYISLGQFQEISVSQKLAIYEMDPSKLLSSGLTPVEMAKKISKNDEKIRCLRDFVIEELAQRAEVIESLRKVR